MKSRVNFIIIISFLLVLVGCEKEIQFEQVVILKNNFIPSFQIKKIQDVSYSGAIRKSIKITVPKDLNKNDLNMNLKYAARDVYNKYKPDAIAILAYKEGSNINSVYDAAEAYFAPFGDWSRANEKVDLSQYRFKFKLSNRYYVKPNKVKLLKIGDKIKLIADNSKSINLSQASDAWDDDNIILRITKTTDAEILGLKQFDIGAKDKLLRYLIKLNYNNKSYQGWIHGWDIK